VGSVVGSVEEGDDLGTVAGGVGAELGGGQAVGDAVLHGPENGLIEEIGVFHIGEGGNGGHGLRGTHGAPQEGDHGGPVTDVIGAELVCGNAVGDALFHSPQDRLIEEIGGLHIGEGVPRGAGLGGLCSPVQEGDHMGPEALTIGVEGGVGCAGGDAVLQGPQDGLIVVTAIGDIGEGVDGI